MEEIEYILNVEEIIKIFDEYQEILPSLKRSSEFRLSLAQKIHNNGYFIILKAGIEKLGFAAFYANNYESKEAFLTLIAVREEYKGLGYAQKILEAVIDKSICEGMKLLKLEVRKNNLSAIRFYKKNNFEIISSSETSFFMSNNMRI